MKDFECDDPERRVDESMDIIGKLDGSGNKY